MPRYSKYRRRRRGRRLRGRYVGGVSRSRFGALAAAAKKGAAGAGRIISRIAAFPTARAVGGYAMRAAARSFFSGFRPALGGRRPMSITNNAETKLLQVEHNTTTGANSWYRLSTASEVIIPQGLGFGNRIGRQVKVVRHLTRWTIRVPPQSRARNVNYRCRLVGIYRGKFDTTGNGMPTTTELFEKSGEINSFYNDQRPRCTIVYNKYFTITSGQSTASANHNNLPFIKNLSVNINRPYIVRWTDADTTGVEANKTMGKVTWFFFLEDPMSTLQAGDVVFDTDKRIWYKDD